MRSNRIDRCVLAAHFGGIERALFTIAEMAGINIPNDESFFSSPFREDRNPSCKVRFMPSGEPIYWDWGMDEHQKIDFIALHGIIHGVDNRESFKRLSRIVRGELSDGVAVKIAQIPKKSIKPQPLAMPPEFHCGWTEDLWRICKLRNIPLQTLKRLRDEGWLRFCQWKGESCWVLREASGGGVVSIRRLDGKEFLTDGKPSGKSRTFKVSPDAFNGIGFQALKCGDYRRIVFVEGTPDFLTAHSFIDQLPENQRSGVLVLCVLGATQKMQEAFIPFFKGKRVCFYPHVDSSGFDLLEREGVRILKAFADDVTFFSFGGRDRYSSDGIKIQPVKDLNDLCFETVDSWERNLRINPLEF